MTQQIDGQRRAARREIADAFIAETQKVVRQHGYPEAPCMWKMMMIRHGFGDTEVWAGFVTALANMQFPVAHIMARYLLEHEKDAKCVLGGSMMVILSTLTGMIRASHIDPKFVRMFENGGNVYVVRTELAGVSAGISAGSVATVLIEESEDEVRRAMGEIIARAHGGLSVGQLYVTELVKFRRSLMDIRK